VEGKVGEAYASVKVGGYGYKALFKIRTWDLVVRWVGIKETIFSKAQ